MLPVEALMQEHRIIERMLLPFTKEVERMEQTKKVNVKFVEIAVDFIKTYADRTHHGKEEGVLFRELRKKSLSNEHAAMMMSLIEEHVLSRKSVNALEKANMEYVNGNVASWSEVSKNLKVLVELYPRHIEKEEKKFFLPSMEYFSVQEREAMMNEFGEFDRKIIHEKYERVVGELEKIVATE